MNQILEAVISASTCKLLEQRNAKYLLGGTRHCLQYSVSEGWGQNFECKHFKISGLFSQLFSQTSEGPSLIYVTHK